MIGEQCEIMDRYVLHILGLRLAFFTAIEN
jgi:hypothetical protein